MSKADWSKAPRDAEFFANGLFRKLVTGIQNPQKWILTGWTDGSLSLNECVDSLDYELRPTEWPSEQRIDIVGTNGGDGMHYDEQREAQSAQKAKAKSKYHRIIKGVEIDVYDVLLAYNVTCPATAHAIKKLLMPGGRHAKTWEQDINEAIASLQRAKELRQ